jgi:hypothetical protein
MRNVIDGQQDRLLSRHSIEKASYSIDQASLPEH